MILVIDGDNLGHRVFHTPAGSLTTKAGEPSGVMMGVIKAIKGLIERFPETTKVIVTWDTKGGSNWRKVMSPAYKANRDYGKDDDEKKLAYQGLWAQMQECHTMLYMLGVDSVKVEGAEADDLMYLIATHPLVTEAKEHVMIVTSDKDMLQLINDQVSVYSPHRDKVISPIDFIDETGVTQEAYLGFRALVGDKSDNIIGIKGIAEGKAKKLMDEFGHIDNLLNAQGDAKKKLMKSKVFSKIFEPEGLQALALNNKIMNLKHAPNNEWANAEVMEALMKVPEVNSKMFKQWLIRWQFASVLENYMPFITPFLGLGDDE